MGSRLNQPQISRIDLRLRTAAATIYRMRTFTAVVDRDPQTKLFVGYVPGFSGAHSQGATMDELRENLREVISMLLEDGEPELEAEFVGTEAV